jgi:hypothetical protein
MAQVGLICAPSLGCASLHQQHTRHLASRVTAMPHKGTPGPLVLLLSRAGLCFWLILSLLYQPAEPEVTVEVKRVKSTGGWVYDGRVCNILAVSRAFGDWEFKVGQGVLDQRCRTLCVGHACTIGIWRCCYCLMPTELFILPAKIMGFMRRRKLHSQCCTCVLHGFLSSYLRQTHWSVFNCSHPAGQGVGTAAVRGGGAGLLAPLVRRQAEVHK